MYAEQHHYSYEKKKTFFYLLQLLQILLLQIDMLHKLHNFANIYTKTHIYKNSLRFFFFLSIAYIASGSYPSSFSSSSDITSPILVAQQPQPSSATKIHYFQAIADIYLQGEFLYNHDSIKWKTSAFGMLL